MSGVRTRLSVDVAVGTEVNRADAIFGVLSFVLDFLRLGRAKPLLEKGVRDHPWLTHLWIVSTDDEKTVYQELVFRIDWDRHEVRLSSGKGKLTIPDGKGIVSSVAPELTRALRMFDEHRVHHGLRLNYYVAHRTDPRTDVGQALGLGSATALKYAGDPLDVPLSTGELDELGAVYRRYGSPETSSKPDSRMRGGIIGTRW